MTTKEIRELSPVEQVAKLREVRGQFLHLRLRKQTGQIEKTHELRALRKDIARLETIVRQKPPAPATA
jgi:large subunit ribosomal protein L29